MLTYSHIINLLLNNYHDGRYLNSHPEVCEWLDCNPDKTYFIQQMADELGAVGYHNVRVWSSYAAYEESLKKRYEIATDYLDKEEKRLQKQLDDSGYVHPIIQQLYDACERKDIDLVFELKRKARALGLKFNKQTTNIREMI